MFNGKSVLITGGTGSFGKRYVRTLVERYKPKRLIIYSRDELKQFEMQQQVEKVLERTIQPGRIRITHQMHHALSVEQNIRRCSC